MSDKMKTELESLHAIGAATAIVTQKFNGIEHVLVPPGSSLKSLEDLMERPNRIKAHPVFTDISGFCDYVEQFKQDGSRIFIDDKNWSFDIVFDSHHVADDKPVAEWGDHKARYDIEIAREWSRFKGFDGKKMSQYDLAEFLEDNLAYIAGPIAGAELLAMAQNIKVQLKGSLEVEETVSRGLKHLTIRDDSVIQGRCGEKVIEFPEKLQLNLRIFKNADTYPIDVFLRMRRQDDKLVFWITIPDPDAIEEAAFDHIIEKVRDTSQLPTLKGSYTRGSDRY